MPRLSDSMEEGTVLKWLVEEGGEVKRGEPLVEIETDKANMTYEADTDGVLIEVIAEEGDTLAVGEVIARIGEAGEKPSGDEARSDAPRRPRRSGDAGGGRATRRRPPPPSRGARDAREAGSPRRANGDGRVKASPVARRMAGELGVELAQLEGSGPGGRIVKADVEAAAKGDGAQAREAEPRRRRPSAEAAEPPRAARRAPRARSRSRSSRACSRPSRAGWRSRRPPRRTSRSRSTST